MVIQHPKLVFYTIWTRRGQFDVMFPTEFGDRDSIPGRDKPKSLSQAVTAPLPAKLSATGVSVTGPRR